VLALGIRSSADLEPPEAVGDRRGEEALDLALNLDGPGYHAFVCGLEGPDRLERLASLVPARLRRKAPLPDWVYVHSFTDANRPRAIRLAAGEGRRLETELGALLRGLSEDLPKAFREEAFETEKAAIVKEFDQRYRAQQQEIQEIGRRSGFAVAFTPQGSERSGSPSSRRSGRRSQLGCATTSSSIAWSTIVSTRRSAASSANLPDGS
jgi:hypothetical protein